MPDPQRTPDPDGRSAPTGFLSAWHATGDPEADAMVAKSTLVFRMQQAIEARNLTQSAAAQILGIKQPALSRILSGHFRSITFDQLFKLLNRLGVGVRVAFLEDDASVHVET